MTLEGSVSLATLCGRLAGEKGLTYKEEEWKADLTSLAGESFQSGAFCLKSHSAEQE